MVSGWRSVRAGCPCGIEGLDGVFDFHGTLVDSDCDRVERVSPAGAFITDAVVESEASSVGSAQEMCFVVSEHASSKRIKRDGKMLTDVVVSA